jgi:hypothetical protein
MIGSGMFKNFLAILAVVFALIETGFIRLAVAATALSETKSHVMNSGNPLCIEAESDIAKIKHVQQVNQKTSFKYDGYRKALNADTTLQLATRLAYAETVAANCPEQEAQVVDLIAAVIGNRIRIRHGDVSSVVFQRDQFASSLNIYAESRYRDFLCPADSELWQKTLTTMRAHLEAQKSNAFIPNDSVNYYLYRHSDRLKAPNWKLEEVSIGDSKTRECIRVFRDPRWK